MKARRSQARGCVPRGVYLVSRIQRSGTVTQHSVGAEQLPGCSKWPSSAAAASEEVRRTLRYGEPLSDARTKLADFFSILLHPGPMNFTHVLHPAHRANNPSDIVRNRDHPQLCTVAVGCSAKFLYDLSQL